MKILVSTLLIAIFSLTIVVTPALAGSIKYTFNDVIFSDNSVGEIEAAVKDSRKSDFTSCSYFSDDYVDHLGYYSEPTVAGSTAEEVKTFCEENYINRW